MTSEASERPCGFCRAENDSASTRCSTCGSPLPSKLALYADPPLRFGADVSLGRFTVLSLVASSKTSSTYRARDHQLGTQCWLRCLHQRVDGSGLDLIDGVLQATRQFRHPNVAPLEDVFTERGHLFAIYPRLTADGLPGWFQDAVHAHPERRSELAWYVVSSVAHALAAAHAQNLSHGSLQEQDIAVTAEPEGLRLRLVGLNLTHALSSRSAAHAEKVTTDLAALAALAKRLLGTAASDPRWSATLERASAFNVHERHASLAEFAAEIAPRSPASLPLIHPLHRLRMDEGSMDLGPSKPSRSAPFSELLNVREPAEKKKEERPVEPEVEVADESPLEDLDQEFEEEREEAAEGASSEPREDTFPLDQALHAADDDRFGGEAPEPLPLEPQEQITPPLMVPPPPQAAPAGPAPAPSPKAATQAADLLEEDAPVSRSKKRAAAPSRMKSTGRERIAQERPAIGEEPGTVTRTPTYFVNARYYSRMIRGRTYRVDLMATLKEVRRVLREHQAEVSADTGVRVRKEKQTMRFVPRFPGCLAVPSETSFVVSRDLVTEDPKTTKAQTQFWLTPLAADTFEDACIDVYVDGEYLMALRTPTVVVTHFLAKVSIALAVVLPVVGSILRGFDLTLEDQIRQGFPALQWIGRNLTGPIWHVAFFVAFAALSGLTWYFRRARITQTIEPLGSLD